MIDENTVAVVAASCRAGTFSALTRDEHTDLVRSIILAYEAAKPVPPMSTSGEMVDEIEREMMTWRGANGGVYTIRACAAAVAQKMASRIEALEALVADADTKKTPASP